MYLVQSLNRIIGRRLNLATILYVMLAWNCRRILVAIVG